MKLRKLQIIITPFVLLAAGPVFADFSYNVTVDTASLNNQSGYLYYQLTAGGSYVGGSTVSIGDFVTDGTLEPAYSVGGAVNGTLPGEVSLESGSTLGLSYYIQSINFGKSLSFNLDINPANGVPTDGAGFADTYLALVLTSTNVSRNALSVSVSDTIIAGVETVQSSVSSAQGTSVIPTPIPAAAYLFGTGLLGLVTIRKKAQN